MHVNYGNNVELEELMESTRDSAFDGDSSFERLTSTQEIIEESLKMNENVKGNGEPYRPQV